MHLVTVKRGRYDQVAFADKSKVSAKLDGCVVKKAFVSNDGKRYAKFDMSRAIGDKQLLLGVQEHIKQAVNPRFSPLRFAWEDVTVKLMATKWEIGDQPAAAWELREGDVVDLVVSPGAFASFGWCLIATHVRRSPAIQS